MPQTVRINQAGLRELMSGGPMAHLVQRLGEQVAQDAARLAPRRTGAGAASIRPVVDRDERGVYADVSWDRAHFYLWFAEAGTSRQSARPFLRPALSKSRGTV